MPENNLLIAGFHCNNHSLSAGYDQIMQYLPADIADANKFYGADADFGSFRKKINLLLFELKLKGISSKYDLIHYLYPELHLLFSVPQKPVKKIGTIHLPLNFTFRNKPNFLKGEDVRSYLKGLSFKRLDGIIALSTEQIDEIRFYLKDAQIKFIPHGVNDYSRFSKIKNISEQFNIITIGSNYRDLNLYIQVIRLAAQKGKNWTFHYVGANSDMKMQLAKFKNVIIHPFLDENSYLELISKSDLHFLPLTFATANNALLESHSVGIPSIVSNLNSVKDYSLSTTSFFNDSEEAFDLINKLSQLSLENIKNKTLLEVKKFHWQNIANQTLDFYNQILI